MDGTVHGGEAHRSATVACPHSRATHKRLSTPACLNLTTCRHHTSVWYTTPTRRRHIVIPSSFADFDYEPETPEEVAADWEGPANNLEDAFLGTDAIDEVTEVLFKESITPEYYFQNALALALAAVCIVSFVFILLRLVVVLYSLIAAAVRYSVVAILVLVLFLLVA